MVVPRAWADILFLAVRLLAERCKTIQIVSVRIFCRFLLPPSVPIMAVSLLSLFVIVSIPLLTWASGPTSIFINNVPEYSLLESCAEIQVSTIVRDMVYACGDDSKLTSYACFCYQSSARVSSMIGKHVSSACNPQFPAQNTSAIEVFSSYCELGAVAPTPTGSTTSSSASQISSASPASGPASNLATATGSSTPTPPPQKKKTNTVAIACGVAIPVGVIAIAAASFLLWRHRRKTTNSGPVELGGGEEQQTQEFEAGAGPEVYELKNHRWSNPPVEMDTNVVTPEMGNNEKRDEKKEPI
ncbi:hypothetical protein BDV96DRAFT_181977 [Lophiotrema nucula]|uniref:Extracellular membrane protein CFEM domain-containing protein n=1 Tax=Lophiotrema nucula TaxID=690887 RepID=A0A6A5YX59_9PLEO|nr:hypothetical protein BDV96DRAFT_181977 [Lophiotrema nucula]